MTGPHDRPALEALEALEALAEARARVLAAAAKTEADVAEDPRLGLALDVFLSSITTYNRFNTLDEVTAWIEEHRARRLDRVERVDLGSLDRWYVEPGTGNIRHESGRFFSIEGVRVEAPGREVASWCEPIIHQPEVGILGIVVQRFDGVLHFLMQAKTEPGNVDGYQLSPTVQATQSNYTQIHGGKLPPFVELFVERRERGLKILYEGLQSEEGARFWKKNNLNVILEVEDGSLSEPPAEFRWLTLFQIKRLLRRDNMVNVCARSVLACLP